MRIELQRFTCQKCGNVFESEIVLDAPIDVAIASMRAVSCPACGASKVGLGGEHKDKPPVSASLESRIAWWRERGAVGTSSETIMAAMTGLGCRTYDYPYDPDDYRRCRLLFDLIPEWRPEIWKVALRFPWMAPFVAAWDEFDRLWDEEAASGKAPKLYAAMGAARKEADKIREGAA